MKRITTVLAGSTLLLLALSGCGSGNTATKVQQKTATITFSTVSSAHTAPLAIIQLSAKLPAGTSISDVTTALVGRNDTGKLLGSPLYSPSTQTITFSVTSTSEPIRFGTFAVLKCDITPGYTLDQSSFTSFNTPFPDLVLNSGPFNGNTVDLKPEIPVTLSVSFGY